MAQGIFISNLPYGIQAADLRDMLIRAFPEDFRVPLETGSARVEVFQPGVGEHGKEIQVAVVHNITIDIPRVQMKASVMKIGNTYWQFLKDTGEARDEFGQRMKKLSSSDVRALKKMEGNLPEHPLKLFAAAFLDSVGTGVFTGSSSLFVKTSKRVIETMQSLGIRATNDVNVKGLRKVMFASPLDALQALTLLNGKGYVFCDKDGKVESKYNGGHGLGLNGSVLDIGETESSIGYIPFDNLYVNIFDFNTLQKYDSLCWRCKRRYVLLGVSSSLSFVAGQCVCAYDSNKAVMSDSRAYFWHEEKFTRLFLAREMDLDIESEGKGFRFMIQHMPMKQFYENPKSFQLHAGPLLQEEWKAYAKGYKDSYACQGTIKRVRVLETVDAEGPVSYVSVRISVRKTAFWNSENFSAIGRLLLQYKAQKRVTKITKNQESGAKLCGLVNVSPNECHIIAKLTLQPYMEMIENSQITVIPKPIKTSYNRAKHVMNNWVANPDKYPFLQSFVDSKSQIQMSERCAKAKKPVNMSHRSLVLARATLNPQQQLAMDLAIASPISVIQGPPGTGKTYTAAVLATTLAKTETGRIIAVAPSNFAVNNLAESIGRVGSERTIRVKVLRIFAKKLEHEMISNNKTIDLGPNVTLLHEAVLKHPRYLEPQDPKYQAIREKMLDADDTLTQEEETYRDEYIKEIEKEIIAGFEVITATTVTAVDGRLFSSGSISTVIIDEAGQLKQAETMSMFAMKQYRCVLIGDDMQLRPRVQSYSADVSGLSFSVMDWFRINDANVPWTMLEIQHRMSEDNSWIVSELSYHGKLKIAACVNDVPERFHIAKRQLLSSPLKSSVLVLDHDFAESRPQVGHSIFNKGEIKLTGLLCRKLLKLGLTAEDITVLTLYENQKKEIKRHIEKSNINCQNVDAFQGKESNVVILSMTRGGKGGIGFLREKNRLNVALSRSKYLLIVLCNIATFKQHRSEAVTSFLSLIQEKADIRNGKDFLDENKS